MGQSIRVLGYGAVGRAVTEALLARGDSVCVAQRKRPADLPAQAAFQSCDVLDAAAVRKAVEGVSQVVLSVGFPYDAKLWRKVWPATITNVVEACAATGARIVFLDNLYMLGPQREARREDMPLTARGNKPAILAEVTRIWSAAAVAGRVRMAALRATDFYGPGVTVSHLGPAAFGAIARGRPAMLLAPPDTPHDFAYVPDIARAIATLLDAPDDAYGQIWNMPCAPVTTPRVILQMGADALGVKLKIRAVPRWSWPILGLFWKFLREVSDRFHLGPRLRSRRNQIQDAFLVRRDALRGGCGGNRALVCREFEITSMEMRQGFGPLRRVFAANRQPCRE